ncbi:MAG: sigma-54 interaction domain-containing protein [Anaerovoracaceae bacterium]
MYNSMAASIFTAQNFFDEMSIFDTDCICRYCEITNPDTYSFTADDIVGKHLFDIFPASNAETSEVYRVLQTGRPMIYFEQNALTYKGDAVTGFSSVYPLFHKGKLVGAALALKMMGDDYKKEFINVQDHSSTRSRGAEYYSVDDIITCDPAMKKLKQKILKVRNMDSSVLIQGSTGTGKELVAQSLHYSSSRASMPFISLNCSAIPENLLESTIFGTEKGSYTGAVTRKGLFELADKGTLFLDELNSLPMALQAKLLKAIESKSFRHLGGHDEIRVDTRIIAAINEEPFEAMKKGRLRSDLFYRLNVITFQLPDLKDRQGDVEYLTRYYVDYFNEKLDMDIQGLSPEATALFAGHDWPGNVRELRNMLEGAFAAAESRYITPEDLPDYLQKPAAGWDSPASQFSPAAPGFPVSPASSPATPDSPLTYQQQLEAFERDLLRRTLASCRTKTEAAEKLGMTRQALNYRLTALQLK